MGFMRNKYLCNHFVMLLIAFIIAVPLSAGAGARGNGASLSEINFNEEESVFLKDIPWSKNDPFVHPVFEVEQTTVEQQTDIEILKEPEPPELALTAVLYSSIRSSAVVNGMVVRVGSVIGEQKVLEINRDSIKVEFNGKAYEIKLKSFSIGGEKDANAAKQK